MRSIKPGRGPSGLNFAGSVISVIFGVLWTIVAAILTSHSPFGGVNIIFPLFGVLFIIFGIVNAAYHHRNATGKDRYSLIDITDSSEEGDPSDEWIREKNDIEEEPKNTEQNEEGFNYCPYCRFRLQQDYVYCPKCGKEL